MRDRRALWAWAPALAYAALIFALSSIPAKSMPQGRFWDFDKVIHMSEFGVLCALLALALVRTTRLGALAIALVAFLLTSGYGVSDELHQSFVPGRFSSVFDVMADVAGALVAALAFVLWHRRTRAGLR